MTTDTPDIEDLTLDANAVAGLLYEIFGTEMTSALSQCAHCGNRGQVGTLRAYVHAPGTVLRCVVCAHQSRTAWSPPRRGDARYANGRWPVSRRCPRSGLLSPLVRLHAAGRVRRVEVALRIVLEIEPAAA